MAVEQIYKSVNDIDQEIDPMCSKLLDMMVDCTRLLPTATVQEQNWLSNTIQELKQARLHLMTIENR